MSARLDPRPVLVAPDSFKGTLSAGDVAAAIARGLEAGGVPAETSPLADGGEGTLAALVAGHDATLLDVDVHDPLERPIRARVGLIDGGATAIVELAQASGLTLVAEHERDAERATTRGTGELLVAAAEAGARSIVLAVGGSATTDGGAGALAAIDAAGGLDGASVTVLCDVRTPFEQAAKIFGPQKGADAAAVKRLARRLDELARDLRRDPRGQPLTGAGGGIAGGLWAALGARLVPGAAYVLDAVRFDDRMRRARAVVVGEGRLDRQTLAGKVVAEAAIRCRQAGVGVHAIVGRNDLDRFDARLLDLQQILEAGTPAQLEAAGRELAGRL